MKGAEYEGATTVVSIGIGCFHRNNHQGGITSASALRLFGVGAKHVPVDKHKATQTKAQNLLINYSCSRSMTYIDS